MKYLKMYVFILKIYTPHYKMYNPLFIYYKPNHLFVKWINFIIIDIKQICVVTYLYI